MSREEIQKALWRDETFVDFDQGLNYCIRQIRVALEDSAEQPIFIATVPRRGYRFIAEVGVVAEVSELPLVSSQISPSPKPIAEDLEGPRPKSEELAIPLDVQQPARAGMNANIGVLKNNRALLGIVAVLFFAALIYFGGGRKYLVKVSEAAGEPSGHEASNTPVRTSVAVLGFANLEGKESDAWLSTALSEMFSTELAEGGKLRLIPGEEVSKARPPFLLPESFSRETLNRLRQQLGADVVLVGSYVILTENRATKLRVDLRLQNAKDGQILAALSQTGNAADLFQLVANTGAKLREKLGAGALSTAGAASFSHSFPSHLDARQLYAEGLDRLRRFDALSASDLLQQATKVEPQFAPAHSALAAAWSVLGYDVKATEEARKAVDLAAYLPREEQLSIQARYYEMAQDRLKAADTLHTLVSFFPDNIDYGIRLATVQMLAGKKEDALSTVSELRKLPEPIGASPRLDVMEAQIRSGAGDFKLARDLTETAIRKGKAIGAQFLVAQGLWMKASVLERLGLPDASLEASSEAKQIYTDANFPKGVGLCLLIRGDVLYDKGDFNGAKSSFENALLFLQEIGDKKNTGLTFERIGNVYHDLGKFAESQNHYTRALEIYREIDWQPGISSALGNLANTLDALGDLKGSLKMHQEALQLFEQTGQARGTASEIDNIAAVQQEMGDLESAVNAYRKAINLHKQTGYQRGEMYASGGLGDVFLLQNNLDAAQRQYEAARTIGEKIQAANDIARFDVGLATIDFYRQRFSAAEELIRRSSVIFQKDNDSESNAAAYALLLRVLLAEQKQAEAVVAAKEAERYAAQISSLPPHFEVDIALANLDAETGKKDQARKRLQDLLQRSRKGGYEQYSLEARRIWIGMEPGKARNRQLTILAAEAKQKGFALIAVEIERMADFEAANQHATSGSF